MFRRLRELLVRPVPDDLAVCTFECPASSCNSYIWDHCALRRLGRRRDRQQVQPAVVEFHTAVKPKRVRTGS